MSNETYRLTDFHGHAALFLQNRFYAVRDKLRQNIIDTKAISFFTKTTEYSQMIAMREAAPDMWEKLSLHSDPTICFMNTLVTKDIAIEGNQKDVTFREPDSWATDLKGYNLPIFEGLTWSWAPSSTGGAWKVSDLLDSEGGWEEWQDARQYSLWGKEVRPMTSEFIHGFTNLNQVYWSFPELLEVLKDMRTVRQRESTDPVNTWKTGPTIDVEEAYRSCRAVHNRKRRPNIVKTPSKAFKQLVATLKLVG
jgi:hypothetical protein